MLMQELLEGRPAAVHVVTEVAMVPEAVYDGVERLTVSQRLDFWMGDTMLAAGLDVGRRDARQRDGVAVSKQEPADEVVSRSLI